MRRVLIILMFLVIVGFSVIGLGMFVSNSYAYTVSVGYADDLRPSPFFPNPWSGSPNIIFAGTPTNIDAGAIMLTNNGVSQITFNSLVVDQFSNSASFNLWGGYAGTLISPGWSMILTQTTQYNFDTSDQGPLLVPDSTQPRVTFTVDGVSQSFFDTAQVLNTGGSDFLAQNNLNESYQWRLIGTFGGQSGTPVPEPSTLLLLGSGLAGLAALRKRLVRKEG